ncbi:MAG: hypothetical protein K6F63_09845 [Lachnospiraceae bacterium]|nr:hypothetical protein [Lachnospiraceae bacterium]
MSDQQDTKKNSGLYEERRVYGTRKQKERLNSPQDGKKQQGKKKNPNSNVIFILGMAVLMLLISVGIAGLFKKPEVKPNVSSGADPTGTETDEKPRSFLGVVLKVDKEEKKILIRDVEAETDVEVSYDGASKFYGKEGSLITAGVLRIGELLRFTCKDRDPETIAVANRSDEVWEKAKIDDLEIFPDENRMVIRNQNYKYSDNLCIMNNGKQIGISELLPTADRYTIRGKGTTVLEVEVTIGHGTLALANYDDFIGGLVLVGARYAFDIKDPANYVVREGEYRVEASYGRLSGAETINITRDTAIVFDLAPYSKAAVYTPTPTPEIRIATPTPTPLPEGFAFKNLSLKKLENMEYELDNSHAIYVYGPFKGDLYIDGYYLGTIPCDFEKVMGEAELTVIYNNIAHTFKYNGADYDGDAILDYTSACVE